jgi:hypothetical protein
LVADSPAERLEYLRSQILAECISWGEIAELQDLAEHIDQADVLLLQWAGVPEFEDDGPDEEQQAWAEYHHNRANEEET